MNEAFHRWFRDSKVVDNNGQPLIVYHGSPDVRDILKNGFRPFARGEVYFAAKDYAVANSYADDRRAFDYQNAEPHVLPLYLSIQNPLIVDAKGQHWRGTQKHVEEARAGGRDGIIIKNSIDYYQNDKRAKPTTVYAWFNPSQAKIALDGPLISRVDRKPLAYSGPNDQTWDTDDGNLASNPALERQAEKILRQSAKRSRK